MIDYSIPYSFEIKEKPDGTYEIVIHANGVKSTQHAQDFMNDITNFEWQQENPTIH